ncbi:hypothetical protein F4808DRAFT_436929 [Astrocystis sublimbata]|nr:hypothetical protein F4808DRAFT_436923 [Astrocystis sublimbata]KAI0198237.1 hypothetical protein F4808DRAFT_436929 [Astrocystis sublimbata]
MKLAFVSALASLALVFGFEVPYWEKWLIMAGCRDLTLLGSTLSATCTHPWHDAEPNEFPQVDTNYSIDLNQCFANYNGQLNHVPNGGYFASCSCKLTGTKIVCQCWDKHHKLADTDYELDDWRTIQMSAYDYNMACGGTGAIEKREADGKEARAFIA